MHSHSHLGERTSNVLSRARDRKDDVRARTLVSAFDSGRHEIDFAGMAGRARSLPMMSSIHREESC